MFSACSGSVTLGCVTASSSMREERYAAVLGGFSSGLDEEVTDFFLDSGRVTYLEFLRR